MTQLVELEQRQIFARHRVGLAERIERAVVRPAACLLRIPEPQLLAERGDEALQQRHDTGRGGGVALPKRARSAIRVSRARSGAAARR